MGRCGRDPAAQEPRQENCPIAGHADAGIPTEKELK